MAKSTTMIITTGTAKREDQYRKSMPKSHRSMQETGKDYMSIVSGSQKMSIKEEMIKDRESSFSSDGESRIEQPILLHSYISLVFLYFKSTSNIYLF